MNIKQFFVKPFISDDLKNLYALIYNLWSYWDKDSERLFSRINKLLFSQLDHNQTEFIQKIGREKTNDITRDKGFLFDLEKVWQKYIQYITFEGTYVDSSNQATPFIKDDVIAYFSMEYGLHECLPFYSGGLGILSGDHLKAASDIGLPLVGIGLLYKYGYFNQRIDLDGYQKEEYIENKWFLKPIEEYKDSEGNPLIIQVPIKKETIHAKIWRIQVGKIPLYLMDTDITQNPPEKRIITSKLYIADRDLRIQQELLIGRGGIRLLKKLGIEPTIYHLNEGHSAFLIVERLLDLITQKGFTFDESRVLINNSNVFTTHTPVIEGNENYSCKMILDYLGSEIEEMKITKDHFIEFGLNNDKETFWLPALAMRFSRGINGVSKIHSQVSRKMWSNIYQGYNTEEIPIAYVTNGVHVQTWLSMEMTYLFDRYLGPDYLHRAESREVWEHILSVPDSEIWAAHIRRKEQLISFVRNTLMENLKRKGASIAKIRQAKNVLNPRFLTIGFARRFAPYKRANLLLHDKERFKNILINDNKPVQIIFAGKAHPADEEGKKLIKEIIAFAKEFNIEEHVVFIEDYNINVAKHLVQGVDVWLSTPIKPLEACGTSGMKAGINGVLNFSVLDGWWAECYTGENGWAITAGEQYADFETKKNVEANQIYEILEEEITKIFFERNEDDVPESWVNLMKNSIYAVGCGFNMHRVLRDYFYQFYFPQGQAMAEIIQDNGQKAKEMLAFKKKIDPFWSKIFIRDFFYGAENREPVSGETLKMKAYVYFDHADPVDFTVSLLYYPYECLATEKMTEIKMKYVNTYKDNVSEYNAFVTLKDSGIQSIAIRIQPAWELFANTFPEYKKWK